MNWMIVLGIIMIVAGLSVYGAAFKKENGTLAWQGRLMLTISVILIFCGLLN